MNNQRYESGLNKLNEIDGEAGQKVIDSLASISLYLAKYTIEFPHSWCFECWVQTRNC
jgi:4-carboxymuconolactone decarboxylase